MGRVHKDHAGSTSGAVERYKAAESTKAPFRVVFEEIAQKKKLQTYISFDATAPLGYTFIPAGDPQLTRRCKQISKQDGVTVFIVSAGAHAKLELSREVHRAGYHFSNPVVAKACHSLGVTLNAAGRVEQSHLALLGNDIVQDTQAARATKGRKPKSRLRKSSPKIDTSLSQAVIDTQARQAIEDLFPKIPKIDLHEVISRAFDKTKGLVGTATGTSLVRRANLAVVAHIRHTYTNYDELLRAGMNWMEARKGVEQFTLDKLVSWRGDDEEEDELIEDVLREVVIISDDEEDDDIAAKASTIDQQFSTGSSESDRIHHANLRQTAVDLTMMNDEGDSSDSDEDITIPYHKPIDKSRGRQAKATKEARRGLQRHLKWAQALRRHKKQPDQQRKQTIGRLAPKDSQNGRTEALPENAQNHHGLGRETRQQLSSKDDDLRHLASSGLAANPDGDRAPRQCVLRQPEGLAKTEYSPQGLLPRNRVIRLDNVNRLPTPESSNKDHTAPKVVEPSRRISIVLRRSIVQEPSLPNNSAPEGIIQSIEGQDQDLLDGSAKSGRDEMSQGHSKHKSLMVPESSTQASKRRYPNEVEMQASDSSRYNSRLLRLEENFQPDRSGEGTTESVESRQVDQQPSTILPYSALQARVITQQNEQTGPTGLPVPSHSAGEDLQAFLVQPKRNQINAAVDPAYTFIAGAIPPKVSDTRTSRPSAQFAPQQYSYTTSHRQMSPLAQNPLMNDAIRHTLPTQLIDMKLHNTQANAYEQGPHLRQPWQAQPALAVQAMHRAPNDFKQYPYSQDENVAPQQEIPRHQYHHQPWPVGPHSAYRESPPVPRTYYLPPDGVSPSLPSQRMYQSRP